jgi:hypothetical protein
LVAISTGHSESQLLQVQQRVLSACVAFWITCRRPGFNLEIIRNPLALISVSPIVDDANMTGSKIKLRLAGV